MANEVEEIKRKIDIVDLVSSYVPLQKAGKNHKALCPFHSEKTPSFMVSPQLQIFKCFGCGEGGDIFSFYSKMENVPFSEALNELARRAGVKLPSRKKTPEDEQREKIHEINRLSSDFFHFLLKGHKIGGSAREFLKKRGVKDTSVEEFGLGYAPDSWDSLGRFILKKGYSTTDFLQSGVGSKKEGGRGYFDFFRGRLIFPLRSSAGRVVGFSGRALGGEESPKYLNSPETPVFEKRRFLYNLDLAKREVRKKKDVLLVEGMMDVIALWERGIKNAVATGGTALSAEHVAQLAKFANRVTICFDRDAAGLAATKKGILLAQSAGLEVRAVLLPEGEDPDKAIRDDEKGFKKLISQAPSVFDYYLSSALSRFDPDTAAGKKEISQEILPLVKSLANEVEKAAYIGRLSEVLEVAEEVLWRQLEREQAIEDEEAFSRATKTKGLTSALPKKEAYLMALLFSAPAQRLRSLQRKIALEDLDDEGLRKILLELREYLKGVKRFLLQNFSVKLGKRERKVLEELVLLPLPQSELAEEFSRALSSVKKARLVRERRDLVSQVREAEREGKTAKVRKLQKQIHEISSKIDSAI